MKYKTDYNREELIGLLAQSFVPEERWHDRDSARAQKQVGECLALLKDGCDFEVLTTGHLKTDDKTVWVKIWFKDFQYFEYHDKEESERNQKGSDTFYIPTGERLNKAEGSDWYQIHSLK